ncbi:MAG TPA: Maf family protein [Solirubrobacteraceae bacterium]|nr:Maf family protein [Solirubrobacteraceae bacterium]
MILASRSPQRRALLEQLGLEFEVVVPEIDEVEDGPADSAAVENARRKATAVAGQRPDALVLGVDTMVALDRVIYGKPEDGEQARDTLRALSGRAHAVISGVCLVQGEQVRTAVARTMVRFRYLDEQLIDWYLNSGEWRERAGGYAIQGRGAALVAGIEGDYTNVVGLPLTTLLELAPELL